MMKPLKSFSEFIKESVESVQSADKIVELTQQKKEAHARKKDAQKVGNKDEVIIADEIIAKADAEIERINQTRKEEEIRDGEA